MKQLITQLLIIVAVVCVAACSTTPRQYDNIEYLMSVSTTVSATRAIHLCDDNPPLDSKFWEHVQDANTDSMILDEYLKNKVDSEKFVPAVDNIRTMVNEVIVRQKFTQMYCVLKLTNIQAASRIVSRASGQFSNVGMCEGGIKDRFYSFKDAYDKNKIAVYEYKELVTDILKLQNIDTAGCSITEKQKMLEDLQLIETYAPDIMKL